MVLTLDGVGVKVGGDHVRADEDVVQADADVRLYEVIQRFKEREIGRLIVVDGGRPIGILTQSDIIRVFPSS